MAQGAQRRSRYLSDRPKPARPQPGQTQAGRARPQDSQGLKSSQFVELVFLPGLDDIVLAEVADLSARGWRQVPGRDDAMAGEVRGSLGRLRTLRTVSSAFLVLTFPVPRPKSLLSGEFFPVIVDAAREVVRLNRSPRPRAVRLEAAGSDSAVMQTFSRQIAQACGLREDHEDGDFVVRVRPTPGRDGWDVLFRLTTRPLSARGWRVQGLPAAAGATVAAAMVDLSGPRSGDRVVDLMCGSGTILIERLLAGPAAVAVGVDADPEAVDVARANLRAAGQRAELVVGDIRDDEWLSEQPYDALFADPPWGDDRADHANAETVHADLLERAYVASGRRARLVVLAHEIRVMDRCLQRAQHQWRLRSQTRVFHKGHHPRIYVLDRI